MTQASPVSIENIYQAAVMKIASVRPEAPDTQTFRLEFTDESFRESFYSRYRVGMFGLYGLPGVGESTFCVASPPTRTEYIECTFRKAGRVTKALADREAGQAITFRGPYGNSFPIDDWKGRNILFIAGGIGMAPVRSVIWNVLDRRDEFADITIVYGARTPDELLYKDELAEWQKRDDLKLITTVDPGGETPQWEGKVGLVTTALSEAKPSAEDCIAVLCGPPIMIKFTRITLLELEFPSDRVYTTLENRMKCGIGKCGRCNVGSLYVCKDGPVFTVAEIEKMPQGDL